MSNHRHNNVKIKRRYLVWLRDAKGLSDASVSRAAASIDRYRDQSKDIDFKAFHFEKARTFKKWLEKQKNKQTDRPLSAGAIDGILRDLKAFFAWLADQPGYRSRISYSDAAYFSPDKRTAKAAHGGIWRPHPSPEDVEHVLRTMPGETVLQRRDQAIIAALYLIGPRDGSLITLRLANVDALNACIHFSGPEVQTKFGKVFTVTFFPVAAFVRKIFEDWVTELRRDLNFGLADPLFPKQGALIDPTGGFRSGGIVKEPWSTAGRVAQICKAAITTVGLPPYTPHLFRKTLVDLADRHCTTPEQFKAWSQNLGHEDVMVTFRSYGAVAPGRQRDVLLGMTRDETDDDIIVVE